MRPKFHSLRVKDVRRETSDSVSVSFEVPADLKDVYAFVPGQYLTLRATIAGEDLRRSYSICSGLDDDELRVAIKKVERGAFSTWVCDHVKVGDEMQVMTPAGHFIHKPDALNKKSYLFLAAGSGITPVMSIARTILRREPLSEVVLVYGNRYFNSIIFRDALEDLKDRYLGRFRVFHVLSGEPNEIPLFSGRIDAEKLQGFCSTFIDLSAVSEVFVCGPEPLIRTVREYARSKGIADENVHFELFATPGATPEEVRPQPVIKEPESDAQCRVSVIMDGQQTDFTMNMDGTVLLDAAKNHGMDIPYSCKGGMCCTCRAHVREGKVKMRVNYALEPGEVDSGFVLSCQSEPLTERIILDFDKQ